MDQMNLAELSFLCCVITVVTAGMYRLHQVAYFEKSDHSATVKKSTFIYRVFYVLGAGFFLLALYFRFFTPAA